MSLLRPIVGFSKVGLLETAEVADNWSISDIPVLITVQSGKIYNQMTSSVFFLTMINCSNGVSNSAWFYGGLAVFE